MQSETYKIAHINEQGQDMIIVPVTSSFGSKSQSDQSSFESTIQYCAADAGLKATVCIVWQVGNRFHFAAPNAWHQFFRSINMQWVNANINRTLTCKIG